MEEVFPLKVFWVEAFPDEDFPVEVFPLVLSDKSRQALDFPKYVLCTLKFLGWKLLSTAHAARKPPQTPNFLNDRVCPFTNPAERENVTKREISKLFDTKDAFFHVKLNVACGGGIIFLHFSLSTGRGKVLFFGSTSTFFSLI